MATDHGGSAALTQTWKIADARANKNGPHHSVFGVRKDKEFLESKRIGLPTAKGAGPYLSGTTYTGDWADNAKDGYGVLTKAGGSKYEGEWMGDKRHGRGTQWVRRDGKLRKQYTGDWVMGRKQGAGVYFYKTGDKYQGEWVSDARMGRGRMEYANGDVYDGEWLDDKRHGMGILVLANGDQYEGGWVADRKEGPGRFFYLATKKMYEGEWVDDTPRCGVFSDIPGEFLGVGVARGMAPEDHFSLPELGLRDPDGALTDAISETRRLARGVVVEGDGEGLALGSPGGAGDYGEGDGEGEGGYGDDEEDYADDQ